MNERRKRVELGWVVPGVIVLGLAMGLAGERRHPAENPGPPGRNAPEGRIVKTDKEWKDTLTREQYRILRKGGTERPFTGRYSAHGEDGEYLCAGCGQLLFSSEDKYDSGCGWPSFTRPGQGSRIDEKQDRRFGMVRQEVKCGRCDGHLGHVFNDGPGPTGLRYCINSAALGFRGKDEAMQEQKVELKTATLGMGCFWCTEALFERMEGVTAVEVGYMGGSTKNPTYKQVCEGNTGHAEVARITYDSARLSYEELLDMFWKVHDPTSLNRQGNDVGTQYRSAIFYESDTEKKIAEKSRTTHKQDFDRPIVTEIVPAAEFYKAENYHQDYFANNPNQPYCRAVIAPKVAKLEKSR